MKNPSGIDHHAQTAAVPASDIAEHAFHLILFYRFLNFQDFNLYITASKLDLHSVTGLYLYRSLGRLVIDQNSSCIAGFICHRTAFDQSGYFQIFIKTATEMSYVSVTRISSSGMTL